MLQLRTHLDPQFRVEIGQRLVHQEHCGCPDNRARQSDTLPLTTGKLSRQPIEQTIQLDLLRRRLYGFVARFLRYLADP